MTRTNNDKEPLLLTGINLPQPSTTAPPNKPENAAKKSEIQALRGVAIFGVLLFHISPDTFKQGFLGVDIFFVISGYLMCSILSKKCPLNWLKILDFYYRRLKRIVPVYLFTIFTVLLFAILFVLHSMDYLQVEKEVRKALIFLSNIPNDTEKGYFERDKKEYNFFLHLWSLSLEIQFYLLVPLLMIVLGYCNQASKYLLIAFVALASFLYQLRATGDHEHMDLAGRIWQFMFGYLIFYLGQTSAPERLKYKMPPFLTHLIDTFLSILLASLLFVEIIPHKQFNRLLVLLVLLVLMSKQSQYKLLCLWPLLELGNVSYSIYMVHWPIFQMHDYVLEYKGESSVEVQGKIMLVAGSILIGYFVEKAWERLAKFVDSWRTLLIVLAVLYFFIFGTLFYMRSNEWNDSDIAGYSNLTDEVKQIAEDAILIHKNQFNRTIGAKEAVFYNQQFKSIIFNLTYCPNKHRHAIPTNYNLSTIGFGNVRGQGVGITASCITKSNGAKNILIIGNSHARAAHFGVEYYFRDIYKHMTMVSLSACNLVKWKGKSPMLGSNPEHIESCDRFVENLDEILRQWRHPIDIIVVAHAYLFPNDTASLPFTNKKNDYAYKLLQNLYDKLSGITKDVVLFSKMQFYTHRVNQGELVIEKVSKGEELKMFDVSYEKVLSDSKNIRDRLDAVHCDKCVPLAWEEIWCNATTKTCPTVNHKQRISYFMDIHHVNLLGSLRVGEYIRKKYDNWLAGKHR